MNEFLETLNQTDGLRLCWYGVFIITMTEVIYQAIVTIHRINIAHSVMRENSEPKIIL